MAKTKKRGGFKNKISSDTKKQKSEGSAYGYLTLPQGISVFSAPPGGRVNLDFMPYIVTDKKHPDRNEESEIAVEGTEWYKRPFKIHRNVGAENETVVCLTSFGKKCPICEYRSKRAQEGAEKEELKEMNASKRNLYCVIPKGVKEHAEEPHIFDMSAYLFQNLLNDELEEDEENAVFPDLEEGKTLRIRFDSATFGSGKPYAETSRIDFDKRKKPYKESILKQIPNLDLVLKELSYKQIQGMFFETEEDEAPSESGDTFVENTITRKKKTTKTTKKEKPEKKTKCPEGHKFGKDAEKFSECDDCTLWKACIKKKSKK